MTALIQYNTYVKALEKMQDDFYISAMDELTGRIVKFSDDYISRYSSYTDDPEYDNDYAHINPNTRMKIIAINRYGRTMAAEVEYLNFDPIDITCFFDYELSLNFLVLVDEGD